MMSWIHNMSNFAMKTVFILACVYLVAANTAQDETKIQEADRKGEMKVDRSHILDSLNLLMFCGLLILTVITIWLFKHRRFRFVHETGLAIIYGLIIGAIIKYSSSGSEINYELVSVGENVSISESTAPEHIRLPIPNSTDILWQYSCKEKIHRKTGLEKEFEEKAIFNPEVFFNVMLPPIIFNAGYEMKRKHFFRNFGAIMTFAFLGTVISCFTVGAILYGITRVLVSTHMSINDCLYFGALISATDPVTVISIFNDLNVDVDLYAMVFGESVLNDAVAIVLTQAIDKYEGGSDHFDGMAVLRTLGNFLGVFLGAFALGSAMGCVTALLTKFTAIRDYPLLETSLFFLMSYSTFLAAEAAKMTGIVAVLFCGICQAHYTYNNLSPESQDRTKQLFELLNFLMENFVFTYIGISVFTFSNHRWNIGFIAAAFLAIIVGRACNVYPLSFLLNLGRSNKIRYNFQHMMMFSGLRGAIAFALAIRYTNSVQRQIMFSTTLLIVISTVILCGGFSTQMLQWLKIRVGVEEDTELQNFEAVRQAKRYQTMDESGSGGTTPVDPPDSTAGNQGIQSPSDSQAPPIPTTPGRLAEKARLVRVWYNIDAKIVKPLLTHARPPLTETLPACCLPLAKLLTTDQQLVQTDAGRRHHEDSDTDLIIDDQELSYGDQSSANGTSEQNGAAGNKQVLPMQLDDSESMQPNLLDNLHSNQNYPDNQPRNSSNRGNWSRSQGPDLDNVSIDLDLDSNDTSPLLASPQQPGILRRTASGDSHILEA